MERERNDSRAIPPRKERIVMYIIQYNGDGTVTISEEIYKELREKANNYQKLVDIVSKAIREAITE